VSQNGDLHFFFNRVNKEESQKAKSGEQVGGDDSHVGFGQKIPGCKVKCETVHCRDATSSSFVAKVPGEVFAHLRSRHKIRR
jgi:hypothetical protein